MTTPGHQSAVAAAALAATLEELRLRGYATLPAFLPPEMLAELRQRLPVAYAGVTASVAPERLAASGERGVVRLPMLFDAYFVQLLALPQLLAIVDATVGATAILHLMNGFVTPPRPSATADSFQEQFHRDFPRVVGGVLLSVNVFVALDDFSRRNGCTEVVPGSHQRGEPPTPAFLERHAVPIEAPAGAALIFDSTLWHRGGWNQSDRPRLALNLQFTKSYLRQQIDYPRALPAALADALPERTRQLLGFYVRVPTSLAEYYLPPEQRRYRAGQG